MSVRILQGDALELLPTLSGLDACVCDPPYHLTSIVKRFGATSQADTTDTSQRARDRVDGYARLSRGFMGKQWDGGDIALRPETWALVLQALKPGAHLLAFGGTRTFHRMACAIEDAGFEIRDTIMWVYGSGFPKSHDVSKGIDKAAGAVREVVGQRDRYLDGRTRQNQGNANHWDGTFGTNGVADITAPATPEAAAWAGWGTALKPAWEPIIVARRPLIGTVAQNVLKHGTGAINVDGCRVGTETRTNASGARAERNGFVKGFVAGTETMQHDYGRWPANLCHDGSDEVLALFPQVASGSPGDSVRNSKAFSGIGDSGLDKPIPLTGFGDSGSAARFFYCSKADADDRAWSKHPTVKPLALMRWLVRLVTPPGGTVLDCFAGSGTTGEAARLEGFNAVLIEREAEYISDIRRRMGRASGDDAPLFAGVA